MSNNKREIALTGYCRTQNFTNRVMSLSSYWAYRNRLSISFERFLLDVILAGSWS